MKTRVPVLAIVAFLAVACGGASESEVAGPGFVLQGAQNIGTAQVPTTTVADDAGASGAAESEPPEDLDPAADGTTTTTLPQNEETQSEKIDDLFTAMRTFNSCLEDEGHSFLGFDPNAPADDPRQAPDYLEALAKCAAVSQIQDALQAADLGSEGKTPEEIETQNRGFVEFTDCLKGRGWNPAPLEPDENGQLQIGDLGAPEGENIFESDDLDECRRIGQAEAESEG
jgi:hypothetical protein